jgi:hypothetical protein
VGGRLWPLAVPIELPRSAHPFWSSTWWPWEALGFSRPASVLPSSHPFRVAYDRPHQSKVRKTARAALEMERSEGYAYADTGTVTRVWPDSARATTPASVWRKRLHIRPADGRRRTTARACAHGGTEAVPPRHHDIVPALPPATWGHFADFGHEYRYSEGEWQRAETPHTPLTSLREVPRSILALLSAAKRRDSSRYTLAEHGPHHYIAALRPRNKVTELGDR